jgi:type IV secretory pathway TraG/TraD family ATPase VirD4
MAAVLGLGLGLSQSVFRLPRGLFGRKKGGQGGIKIAGEFIPDAARLRHTHIVGATGAGKTVLLEQLIFRDLERGHGALIIDPKGDREFYERLRAFVRKIGRSNDLHLLSATYADESVVWNPCRTGNASELQSKFYNAAIYSEPHYAKACELALLKVFNQVAADPALGFDLQDVVSAREALSRGGKDETMAGLFMDLSNLVMGGWGGILGCNPMSGATSLSLLDLTRKNEILFVDLPTEAQAVQSARIGRLLLQEIILISGLRKLYPHLRSEKPCSVFVDEFDAFASPSFATFLNKGRSSDFMIHLAHQTLSDLDKVSPAFRGQIMGNMNVRFIFRQDEPNDAEEWSRFFGTRSVVKRTYQTQDGQSTGMSSNREVQEFRVGPDAIKELKTGECVFGMKTSGRFVRLKIPYTSGVMEPQLKYPVQRDSKSSRKGERPKSKVLTERCNQLAELVAENRTK